MSPDDPGMETPVAPLPAPESPSKGEPRRRDASASKPRKSRALRAGLVHALASWRVLGFVLCVQLLLALTVVLPFYNAVSGTLDHHPHAAALAGSPTPQDRGLGWEAGLDAGIWRDLGREHADLFGGLTLTHFWAAVVAWFFGALVAGGFLGTAVSGENPVRVGAFLAQGARVFGPMLRVGLCFALLYYVVARIVFEAWGGAAHTDEFMAAAETTGWWADRLRELTMVLCFFWFRLAGDLARTELVVYGKRGAVGAFVRGLGRSLRPRSVLVALAIGVPTFLVLLGLGFMAQVLVGGDAWILVMLFLVLQLAVVLRWAGRAALLGAFVKLG